MFNVIAIEGIDRLGKSTLIQNIKDELGFYQVIHFQKPQQLKCYKFGEQLFQYQYDCFKNSMVLAKSGAKLIFDRWHLGEVVYSDAYRGYFGDYVFELEKEAQLQNCQNIKLVLLTEDFSKSAHFISDGESFDDSRREEEQNRFIEAFNKSILPNKQIVCVTAEDGRFRPQLDILNEVLK